MVGIYKIENLLNGKVYIGQSRDVRRRWNSHRLAVKNGYQQDYPLYRAMKKYGTKNFQFSVVEECDVDDLDDREKYWVSYYDSWGSGYNQTPGGNQYSGYAKLTKPMVDAIKDRLLNYKEGCYTHRAIADEFGVSPDTIQAINVGRAWIDQALSYPLHESKYRRRPEKRFCLDCGVPVSRLANRCHCCANRARQLASAKDVVVHEGMYISKSELKTKIREMSFLELGRYYGVSDNTVRKWLKKYGLPYRVAEIQSYSQEEWNAL